MEYGNDASDDQSEVTQPWNQDKVHLLASDVGAKGKRDWVFSPTAPGIGTPDLIT